MEEASPSAVTSKVADVHSTTNLLDAKTYRQWIIAVLVNIILVGYGLQIGWIASEANMLLSNESPLGFPLLEIDIYWLATSPHLAALMCVPMWAVLMDKFGRQPCIVYCAWIQVVGCLFTISAKSMTTLMIGRITGGVAGGGCVFVMPIYIKEISQDDLRGTLGLTVSLARNLGIFVIHAMAGIEYYTILGILLFVSIIGVLVVFKVPESPTYYVKIGKLDLAALTVSYLRNVEIEDKIVKNAVDSIKEEDKIFKAIPKFSYIHILKQNAWRKGFIFMTLLMFCNGLNGGLSIINFAPVILNVSRITVNSKLQSLSIPLVMIIGSLLSIVFIDRLGRKAILALSFLLTSVSFAAVAAILILQQNGTSAPAWLAITVIVVPICTYAGAISPVPFIIAAEMFNFQIRAKVMGWLAVLSWGSAFIQLLIFGPISNAFGPQITFKLFTVVNLCGILVVLVLLPETNKKTIQEIEIQLEKKEDNYFCVGICCQPNMDVY